MAEQQMQLPAEWTIGHGHLGNAPRTPSPTPLGWHVEQHQMPDRDGVLQWEPARAFPLRFDCPDVTRKELWARRKGRNRVKIPDGLEFDQYAAGCAPSGMEGARVRVLFVDEIPAEVAA